MSEFIFMLTHNDRTVDNAVEVLNQVKGIGLRHVGFKDVGATAAKQLELTETAHKANLTVYLEIVSINKADELASVDAAISAGVDWIIGGTFAADSLKRLEGTNIKLAPFPGVIVGHPSELRGSIDAIASQARELTALDGVAGVDLLAYRHKSVDPLELTAAVVAASKGRVIAAGSVVTQAQVNGLGQAGVWGFTIGSAIFDGKLPGKKDVVSQVRMALGFAAQERLAASSVK